MKWIATSERTINLKMTPPLKPGPQIQHQEPQAHQHPRLSATTIPKGKDPTLDISPT
jgi:hypothetical protein